MSERVVHTEPWSEKVKSIILDANPGLQIVRLDSLPISSSNYFDSFGSNDLFLLRTHMSPPHVFAPAFLRDFFKWQEHSNLVRGFSRVFPREQFLNSPASAFFAASKPLQLATAKNVGLPTPATLFTTSRRDAFRFLVEQAEEGKRCVIKTVDTPIAPNPANVGDTLLLYTRELIVADVEHAEIDDFGSPVIVQELIPKAYELRICVFGAHVAFIKIDSQKHEQTKVDWRWLASDPSLVSYEDVDPDFSRLLVAYLRALDLEVGVFDVAVTPGDRKVFLECNAYGQWQGMDAGLGGQAALALGHCIRDRFEELAVLRSAA